MTACVDHTPWVFNYRLRSERIHFNVKLKMVTVFCVFYLVLGQFDEKKIIKFSKDSREKKQHALCSRRKAIMLHIIICRTKSPRQARAQLRDPMTASNQLTLRNHGCFCIRTGSKRADPSNRRHADSTGIAG